MKKCVKVTLKACESGIASSSEDTQDVLENIMICNSFWRRKKLSGMIRNIFMEWNEWWRNKNTFLFYSIQCFYLLIKSIQQIFVRNAFEIV